MFRFFRKSSINSVDVNDLDKLFGKINLIDIREPYEYKTGHLPTAQNVPMNKILMEPQKYLNQSKEYHIVCESGGRSSRTCSVLKEKGFNIINVSGGTAGYRGNLEK